MQKRVDECKRTGEMITGEEDAKVYRVSGDSKDLLGENMSMLLWPDRLEFIAPGGKLVFPIEKISQMAVAHTAFLYFSCMGHYYEVRNAHVWPANKYFALHRMIRGMEYV